MQVSAETEVGIPQAPSTNLPDTLWRRRPARVLVVLLTLATGLSRKGDKGAGWLAAATLNRYLGSIKHPQMFGTQYQTGPDNKETMEPYDQISISDKIRAAWGVNSPAEQGKSLKGFQKSDVPTSSTPARK